MDKETITDLIEIEKSLDVKIDMLVEGTSKSSIEILLTYNSPKGRFQKHDTRYKDALSLC